MDSTPKKWKVILFLFYQYFRSHQSPVIVDDLYDYGYATLKNYGISTKNALKIHTRSLAGRHYLYTIRDRKKPIHYPLPYRFLISKSGLKRLTYENLISQRDQDQLMSYLRYQATEHNVRGG